MTEPLSAPLPAPEPVVEAGSEAVSHPDVPQTHEPAPAATWRSASSAAGVAMSLAIHGAVLAAGLAWAKSDSGAIEELSEAISIEMTMTSVEESVDESPLQDTAASPDSTAPKVGGSEEIRAETPRAEELEARPPPASEVAVVEPDAVPVPPPKGLEVIEGTLDGGEATGRASGEEDVELPLKANKEDRPEEGKAKREAVRPTPDKPRPDDAKDRQRTAALQQGGVASKARSGSVASSGRVSASTGNLVSYKQRVNARVAGNKPAGSGANGTATVSFGVTASGSLSYARLSRSSGSPAADAAAVAAVRRAGPFGPTPTGGPLGFSFSFYFR